MKGPVSKPCLTASQNGGEESWGQTSKCGNLDFPFSAFVGLWNCNHTYFWRIWPKRSIYCLKSYVLLACFVPGPLAKVNRPLLSFPCLCLLKFPGLWLLHVQSVQKRKPRELTTISFLASQSPKSSIFSVPFRILFCLIRKGFNYTSYDK